MPHCCKGGGSLPGFKAIGRMKLQQLRYLSAVAKNNLNISAAAAGLFTSQPGISKQIRLLEEELGIDLFTRNGKHISHITPVGRQVINKADIILREVHNIQLLVREYKDDRSGILSIATTHTQARYALPEVITVFRDLYPEVGLQIHQGSPAQIAELVFSGQVDFAIATEAPELFEGLVLMPCYRWRYCVLTLTSHPLCQYDQLTLQAIAQYPLVTYVFGFTGHSELDMAFRTAGLRPSVVFTATDADVIKTYVRLGLGVGIVAGMAYDPDSDRDLACLDVGDLFPSNITMIGFKRGTFIRRFMYDFIGIFASHLTRDVVQMAEQLESGKGLNYFILWIDLICLSVKWEVGNNI